MDGVEATKTIRKQLIPFRNVKATFVALSAQDEKHIADIHIFEAYRSKPVSLNVLEDLLNLYGF